MPLYYTNIIQYQVNDYFYIPYYVAHPSVQYYQYYIPVLNYYTIYL